MSEEPPQTEDPHPEDASVESGAPTPDKTGRGGFIRGILLFLFAFSPAILCGFFVEENATNVPVWDDWERAVLFEKREDGSLDFAFLNSPHIDHRMLTQRLAALSLNDLTGGNLRVEIFIIYGIFVLCGIGLWSLARIVVGGTWAGITTFVVNLIVFSPIQYQNLLWAVQIAMVIPLACLALIAATMASRWPCGLKTILCAALAFTGVHSFGHGLALWPVAICLALFMRNFAPMKPRLICVAVLGLLAAADIYCYFNIGFEVASDDAHSYNAEPGGRPPGLENTISNTKNLKRIADHMFTALGNVSARLFNANPLDTIKYTGRVLFAVFILLCGYMLIRWKDGKLRDRLLPWAAMGTYSVVAALAIALGRSSLGERRILLTRYISPTMFLLIGIIGMLSVLLHLWVSSDRSRFPREIRLRFALILAVFFATLQWPQWVYGVHKMESWKSARLQGRAALLYINVPRDPDWEGRLDADIEFARRCATTLNRMGYLDPPLADKLDFPPFRKIAQTKANRDKEGIERALDHRAARMQPVSVGDGPVRFKGYALVGHGKQRVADGVFLTWRRDKNDPWKVFALAEMKAAPVEATFLDTYFGHSKGLKDPDNYALWQIYVALEDFPSEATEVTAWALDAENMTAYEFRSTTPLIRIAP